MIFRNFLRHAQLLAIGLAITALADSAHAQRRQQQQDQQDQQQQDQQQQDQQGQQQGYYGGGRRSRNGGGGFNNNGGGYNRQRYPQYSAATGSDDYSIISDQSIFLRQRIREQAPVYTPAAPLPPDQANVLTGIVLDESDNQYRAYFEDLNRGSGTPVKVGDKFINGTIMEIRLDSVGYKKDGASTTTWIEINSNLTGARAGSVQTNRLSAIINNVASQTAAPATPLDPNTANLSMEERLRLRRLAESQGVAIPVSAAPAPPPEPTVDAATALPAVPVDPATANLSVEERMRLRRQQEVGNAPR